MGRWCGCMCAWVGGPYRSAVWLGGVGGWCMGECMRNCVYLRNIKGRTRKERRFTGDAGMV